MDRKLSIQQVGSDDLSAAYASKSGPATTQSPTVTVEWHSKGAINVGQESSCELVVKNSGSVTAKQSKGGGIPIPMFGWSALTRNRLRPRIWSGNSKRLLR